MSKVLLVGIDCAVASKNTGLCRAIYSDSRVHVLEGVSGAEACPAEIASAWIGESQTLILGLDAPLGWPVALGDSLRFHKAAGPLAPDANSLFRRCTDDFTTRVIGKRPMDVGADRIARTAKAALDLLGEIRRILNRPILPGWMPGNVQDDAVLETYPAAFLKAHGLPFQAYKKSSQRPVREEILAGLKGHMVLECSEEPFLDDADILDALLCTLVSAAYLSGKVHKPPPEKEEIISREGWIWLPETGFEV